MILLFFLSVSLYPQNLNTEVSVLESTENVTVKWTVSEGLKYYVYRTQAGGKPTLLTPGGISGPIYSDLTGEEGKAYLYSVRGVDSAGHVVQSVGKYGVKGEIPRPQVETRPGVQKNVLIRVKNRPAYLKVNVSVSRPYYTPRYRVKEAYTERYGNHVVNENSAVPFNYEDSLCYAVDPHRGYTTPSYICRNSPWDEINDTKAFPGNNRYTVQYVYTLPDGKERLSAFTSVGGFRNISDREFLDEVLMTVERSQFKLKLVHLGGTAPNGFDAVEDDTKGDNESFAKDPKNPPNGWLYYDCDFSLRRMVADVTLIYQNYCDYDLFLTTDKTRMHRSVVGPEKITNINDTKVGELVGVILISGIYSGEVEFHIKVGNRNEKPPYAPDSLLYSAEQQERFFYSGKKGPGVHPNEAGAGSYYIVRQKKNGLVVSQSIFAWDYNRREVDSRLVKTRK